MYEYEKPYGIHTSRESVYTQMWERLLRQEEWRGEGVLLPGAKHVVRGGTENWIGGSGRFEFRVGFVLPDGASEYIPGVMFYHAPKNDNATMPSDWSEIENP